MKILNLSTATLATGLLLGTPAFAQSADTTKTLAQSSKTQRTSGKDAAVAG